MASKPQYAKLLVGETGRYDVDEDGRFDVEVSVLGVAGEYVGMSFKRLLRPAVARKFNWVPYIVGFVLVTGALVVTRRRKTGASHEDQ